MDAPSAPFPRPRRLLLATNLTSRTDRALARARQLAAEWNAALHVVHAIEEPLPTVPMGVDPQRFLAQFPDRRTEASRLLDRYLRPDVPESIRHVMDETPPAAAILAVAEREGCDLIVLGEAHRSLFGPIESTVDEVIRTAPVSVLVVRERTPGPYRHVLVGTDFTDEAQQALVAAADLFPAAHITLMHAYSMPYAYLLESTPDGRDWPARQRAKLRAQVEDAALSPEREAAIRSAVEIGPPAAMLRRHVLEKGVDLTVIGAYPRGLLFDAVVGNSRRIVDAIPGDVLMVRAQG